MLRMVTCMFVTSSGRLRSFLEFLPRMELVIIRCWCHQATYDGLSSSHGRDDSAGKVWKSASGSRLDGSHSSPIIQ